MTAAREVAAFDFDGTLVARDSLVPFLRRLCGTSAVARALALELPRFLRAARSDDGREPAKAALFARLLTGRRLVDVERMGATYADEVVRQQLRADTMRRVDWHRRQGHDLVIVSASPELYLVPIGRMLGFDAALGTRLEVESGHLTGRLDGHNVRGDEKVARLRAHLGDDPVRVWAYGDSAGDNELLSFADIATRIKRKRYR